jgi:GntR family transcriptional regulator
MSQIDRDAYKPLYRHVADYLLEQILDGKWLIGSLVPSEDRLVSQFNVSRNTVRKALENLEKSGYLIRVRGRGTFVASSRLNQALNHLTSFSEDVSVLGMTPTHKNINITCIPATEEIAEKLQIPPKSEVIFLHRLLLANNIPYIVMKAYLPKHLLDAYNIVISADTLGEGSLYQFLEAHNLRLVEADVFIRAGGASNEDRILFGYAEGSPVLITERISRAQDCIVEYSVSVGHPERHQWSSKLIRINR